MKSSLVVYLLCANALLIAAPLIEALRNEWRAVETCTTVFMDNFEQSMDESCADYCKHTYFEGRQDTRASKADRVNAYVSEGLTGAHPDQCCCRYLTEWPEVVENAQELISVHLQAAQGMFHCLPLMGTNLALSERTNRSYSRICKFLGKTRPLNMLELLEYVEMAAYLNHMKPKNPMVSATIGIKQVKKIDFEMAKRIRETIEHDLLTDESLPTRLHGYKLDPKRLHELDQVRRFSFGPDALSSKTVANALDEYLISYCVMDLAAAKQKIDDINQDNLHLPPELFDSEISSAQAPDFNCDLMIETKTKLQAYLDQLSITLHGLREKLIFEHLSERLEPLASLHKTLKTYNKLAVDKCNV